MNQTHRVFSVTSAIRSSKLIDFVKRRKERKVNFSSSQRNVSVIFTGRIFLLTAVVLSPLLLSSCSSWTGNTSNNLERQIELQKIQHELASAPVQAEQKTVSDFEQRGDQYSKKNDITRAYLSYAKGLAIEPDNRSLLHKQAALLLKINKFAEAGLVFEKLIAQDSQDAAALAGRGRTYFSQGKVEEAEKAFLAALKIKADDWLAYEYLGLIHSQRQDYEKAISLFRTALSYKPKSVSVTNNMAVTYYLIGDFTEAVRLFREVAATVNDRKIHNNLALAYFQLGQYDKAIESFKKGSADEATAHNNMGREYLSARKYNEAIDSFERAIALHPKYYLSAQKNLDLAKRGLSNDLAEKAN